MHRASLLLVASLLTAPLAARGSESVLLLATSAESITGECRSGGLYLGYQLDDLPACHEFACTAIRARTDGGEWVQYAAHNSRHAGFVRNARSTVRKNGALAETLLSRMLKASSVDLLNPGTGRPVAFPISDSDRASLETVAAKCGAGGRG